MARYYNGFKYVRTLGGTPPAMGRITLTAGSFYEGEILRITSGGKGKLMAVAATCAAGVLAANCNSAQTDRDRPYYLADDNNVFEAVINLGAAAMSLKLADKHGIYVGTTHNYHVAATVAVGNATASVRIVGYHPDELKTATGGSRVFVTFIPKNSQMPGDAGSAV